MSRPHGILKILNKQSFLEDVKKDVLKTFVIVFSESKEFIDAYDDTLLNDKIVKFWFKHYCMIDTKDECYMLVSAREQLRLRLYKDLCEGILNKLVDNGILEMLWDNKKKRIMWRKKESHKNLLNI